MSKDHPSRTVSVSTAPCLPLCGGTDVSNSDIMHQSYKGNGINWRVSSSFRECLASMLRHPTSTYVIVSLETARATGMMLLPLPTIRVGNEVLGTRKSAIQRHLLKERQLPYHSSLLDFCSKPLNRIKRRSELSFFLKTYRYDADVESKHSSSRYLRHCRSHSNPRSCSETSIS